MLRISKIPPFIKSIFPFFPSQPLYIITLVELYAKQSRAFSVRSFSDFFQVRVRIILFYLSAFICYLNSFQSIFNYTFIWKIILNWIYWLVKNYLAWIYFIFFLYRNFSSLFTFFLWTYVHVHYVNTWTSSPPSVVYVFVNSFFIFLIK